jgi:hypothetical protein
MLLRNSVETEREEAMIVYVEAFAPQSLLQRVEWGLQLIFTKWVTGVILVAATLTMLSDFGLIP